MKTWAGFKHGINLGGWLSQCDHTKELYDTFITEADIRTISEWNKIDHIRVPVDYDLVETPEGAYKEEGFAYIAQAINWAEKYGLHMILDLHKTYGFSFDDGEEEAGFFENALYQERFYRLWEQFAARFGSKDPLLAFELLNEVTDKTYCDTWNRISQTCIERIRKIAPTIKILVGGYHNNSVAAVKDLALPYDENIVYNFHCYEPLAFTHQAAHWIATMPKDFSVSVTETYASLYEKSRRLEFDTELLEIMPPEAPLGADFFETIFKEALQTAEERNIPLYCGEYGVIDQAKAEEALLWYRMISEIFDRYDIGRAAWTYKEMDFGLIDPHLATVREEILKQL